MIAFSLTAALACREPPVGSVVLGGPGPTTFVLLHGFGGTPEEMTPFARTVDLGPTGRFIFPRAFEIYPKGEGLQWWALDLPVDPFKRAPYGIKRAARRIEDLINALDRRIILGGFSQGAMVSAEIAFQSRTPLRALVLLSGTTVNERSWERRLRERRDLPIFMSHGRADDVLPFNVSDRFRKKMEAAGLKVTWVPFDGGHEIPEPVVQALNEFVAKLP